VSSITASCPTFLDQRATSESDLTGFFSDRGLRPELDGADSLRLQRRDGLVALRHRSHAIAIRCPAPPLRNYRERASRSFSGLRLNTVEIFDRRKNQALTVRLGEGLLYRSEEGEDAPNPIRFISTLMPNQKSSISMPGAVGTAPLILEIMRQGDRIVVTSPETGPAGASH
jgi:hypothetical protein